VIDPTSTGGYPADAGHLDSKKHTGGIQHVVPLCSYHAIRATSLRKIGPRADVSTRPRPYILCKRDTSSTRTEGVVQMPTRSKTAAHLVSEAKAHVASLSPREATAELGAGEVLLVGERFCSALQAADRRWRRRRCKRSATPTSHSSREQRLGCVLFSRPPSLFIDGRLVLVVERPGHWDRADGLEAWKEAGFSLEAVT
jgi:hypothetical protein